MNWYVVGLPRESTSTVATTGLLETVAPHGACVMGPPDAALIVKTSTVLQYQYGSNDEC